MKTTVEQASEILTKNLVGAHIVRYSVGDAWELELSNNLWIVAHELEFPLSTQLQKLLEGFDAAFLDCVDPITSPLAAFVASQMRRSITSISLSPEARLSLHFENDRHLDLRSDVDIVDWQWSLGISPSNPYSSPFLVACLWAGELEVPGR